MPGASGPADTNAAGDPSGSADVDTAQASVEIALDPAAHAPWVSEGLDRVPSLSVRVGRPEGTGTVFIMSTTEGTDPSKIAQLAVTYCE